VRIVGRHCLRKYGRLTKKVDELKLKNEYLIILDEESSRGFYSLCKDVQRFNEFVVDNSEIKIIDDSISLNNKTYKYSIKKGEVQGKSQIFFYITLMYEGEEDNIREYKVVLRAFKSALDTDNVIVETLRDDLSFYYSNKAYSLVYSIENLMRKFITYFMITNVGKNWLEVTSPEKIKTALGNSKRKQYIDVLQQLDFIHLGDFLFKSYQEDDISLLFDKIKKIDDNKSINIEEIRGFIPKSNWDKYFKSRLNCEDSYLKSRWEKIYDLRNKIAHNSHFTEDDYRGISILVKEVEEVLKSAFDNIDSIELPQDEKDSLTENIAKNIDENLGEFILQWNRLERNMRELVENESGSLPIYELLSVLESDDTIDAGFSEKVKELHNIRNLLVNNIDLDSNERNNLSKYNEMLYEINKEFKKSWKDEIIEAFGALENEATLAEIYDFIKSKTTRSLSLSWRSSVRKTIYLHSSDCEIFDGQDDIFRKIGKGKWGMRLD